MRCKALERNAGFCAASGQATPSQAGELRNRVVALDRTPRLWRIKTANVLAHSTAEPRKPKTGLTALVQLGLNLGNRLIDERVASGR